MVQLTKYYGRTSGERLPAGSIIKCEWIDDEKGRNEEWKWTGK